MDFINSSSYSICSSASSQALYRFSRESRNTKQTLGFCKHPQYLSTACTWPGPQWEAAQVRIFEIESRSIGLIFQSISMFFHPLPRLGMQTTFLYEPGQATNLRRSEHHWTYHLDHMRAVLKHQDIIAGRKTFTCEQLAEGWQHRCGQPRRGSSNHWTTGKGWASPGLWQWRRRRCVLVVLLSSDVCIGYSLRDDDTDQLVHVSWTRGFALCVQFAVVQQVTVFDHISRPGGDLKQWGSDNSAVWVKIVSSWICIGLYIWTLVAPCLLPNREFN